MSAREEGKDNFGASPGAFRAPAGAHDASPQYAQVSGREQISDLTSMERRWEYKRGNKLRLLIEAE